MESFAWCVRCHGRNPSVTYGDSSPKGEPSRRSLPFRGGEPSQTVEGFLCEIFCLMCEVSRKKSLSQPAAASSLFKGA